MDTSGVVGVLCSCQQQLTSDTAHRNYILGISAAAAQMLITPSALYVKCLVLNFRYDMVK